MVRGGLETKSCRACASAKRKCDREVPACSRCRKRGADCTYQASKPTSFVLLGDGEEEDIKFQTPLSFSTVSTPMLSGPAGCSLEIQPLQSGPSRFNPEFALPTLGTGSLFNFPLSSTWFASLDTWEVRRPTPDQILPVNMINLQAQTATIFRWFTQWVEEGHCPFIHAELYRSRFPKFLQEIYTILSSYIRRKPTNERVIFRIVAEHVVSLVREQGSMDEAPQLSTAENTRPQLDALGHLARVHALLIHQMIGLFDGDIRLRHLAEQHIPVLDSWMQQMVLHTQRTVLFDGSLMVPSHSATSVLDQTISSTSLPENALWYTWILSESMRRTWIVASGLQVAYLTIKEGRVGQCQGGMMFTTRKGVWEAKSAAEWEKICSEVNVGLIQMTDVSKIMSRATPDEVSDFAKDVIGITCGEQSMRVWLETKQPLQAIVSAG